MDKFYTIPNIAKYCINIVKSKYNFDDYDLIIEPSAGNGSFYNQIGTNKKIGIDIDPMCSNIVKQDYLLYNISEHNKKILVIGNPPFGKNSSMAIKFFNHSANFALTIAFILPRTFRKISIQNRLSLNFNLVYDIDIPLKPCSFEPKMMAKCCFQIWQKNNIQRLLVCLPNSHIDWQFLNLGPKSHDNQPTVPNGADFALKAYGSNCGEIVTTNLIKLRPKSWH